MEPNAPLRLGPIPDDPWLRPRERSLRTISIWLVLCLLFLWIGKLVPTGAIIAGLVFLLLVIPVGWGLYRSRAFNRLNSRGLSLL